MTTRKPNLLLLGLAGVISTLAVIGIVVWLTSLYFDQHADKQSCHPGQMNHKVVIQNDRASPSNTVGDRCDTLTITNLDDTQRLIAFGPHEDHVAYDGVKEQFLNKGESLTVTMVQTGNFRFHDHIHDEMQATFTVNAG